MKELFKKYLTKRNIIILSIILLVIIIIIIVIRMPKTDEERMKNKVLQNKDFKYDLKQEDISIKEEITISDFKVRYYSKSHKWFLEMIFTNNLDKEISLSNYEITAYDKNEKVVKKIDTSILGKLSPNETRGLGIESKTDISSITKIVLEEKKEQVKEQKKKK